MDGPPAVIGVENDDGVLGHPELLQHRQRSTDTAPCSLLGAMSSTRAVLQPRRGVVGLQLSTTEYEYPSTKTTECLRTKVLNVPLIESFALPLS